MDSIVCSDSSLMPVQKPRAGLVDLTEVIVEIWCVLVPTVSVQWYRHATDILDDRGRQLFHVPDRQLLHGCCAPTSLLDNVVRQTR